MFLDDAVPTVLCSPRKELIHCKAYSDRYIGRVHLFGDIGSDVVLDKINAVKEYICTCGSNPFSPVPKVPKILVTYDSTKHVIQALRELGVLDQFRFVVDEFQTLWTDAAYRGNAEAEFQENLRYLDSVIYLSATPYLANYLDMSHDFCSLPYLELKWPNSSITATQITPELYYNGSPTKTIRRIIEHYRQTGFFEETMDSNGCIVRATEAVFFVNDVKFIRETIQKNNLQQYEVNIICSDRKENHTELKKIGFSVGHAPKEGEPHATYTFATKASYEGTDFYSTCAYTYIFADIKKNWLAVDISLDLPQIMGRQRLSTNAFRYSATLFMKTKPEFTDEEKREYMDNIRWKDNNTKAMLGICDGLTPEQYILQASTLRSAQEKDRYSVNYVTVVDDKNTNKPRAVYNEYVMLNELRAWEVQIRQYTDITYVMGSVNNAFVGNSTATHELVTKFMSAFTGTFEQKMRMYAEFLDAHPDCKDELQREVHIPSEIKLFYNRYGSTVLRSLSWKKSDIEGRFVAEEAPRNDDLLNAIRSEFTEPWYSDSDIKNKLQEIYDRFNVGRTAKAKDIESYLNWRPRKKSISGTRENGHENPNNKLNN